MSSIYSFCFVDLYVHWGPACGPNVTVASRWLTPCLRLLYTWSPVSTGASLYQSAIEFTVNGANLIRSPLQCLVLSP